MSERIAAILSDLRGTIWSSEDDVRCWLICPLLVALGWPANRVKTEVWIPLTEEMARLWNYPSRRMRRDYVLSRETGEVLHIEAKYQWGMQASEIEALLAQVNCGDWHDTRTDGPKKDLASLLWGARSQNSRRAALMDERRLLVFDWQDGWKLVAEEELFENPIDRVHEALRLLEPAVGRMTWQENIQVDTHLAAIRWKANQRKDKEHVRARHSEDRLTWIVYRVLEAEGLVPQFSREVLGLPPAGRVWVYYWQRLPNSECIDHDISEALAEVERYHTEQRLQRTETDLLLVARDWLCVFEHKCGAPKSEPRGWRQTEGSPLRPEYEQFFRPLLKKPDKWRVYGVRFAQLLKNLSLGNALARRWNVHGRPLDLDLGVIINDRVRGRKGDTYRTEFEAFCSAVSLPPARLHLATWQDVQKWLGRRQEPLCRKACHALDENDWL